MKIYLGGIFQETNTFSPHLTQRRNVRRGLDLAGREIRDRLQNTNTEFGGVLAVFDRRSDVEVAPGIVAWALASGKITAAAFQALTDEHLADLKRQGRIDGVLLVLHGAMVSEDCDDCEGVILEQTRRLVGRNTPIVCTLDYHAVVTERMLRQADVLIGYRTYPHVDLAETGEKAARILVRLVCERPQIECAFECLPLILPVENTETAAGPIGEVMDRLRCLDADGGVFSASFFCPHPWLDIADFHLSLLIYYTSAKGCDYRDQARRMLGRVWERREEFFFDVPDLHDFAAVADRYAKPVVLIDTGDIISAGGGGDSTEIVRFMLANHMRLKTIVPLVDRATVEDAYRAGEGREAEFNLGAKNGNGYNKLVSLNARVRKLCIDTVAFSGSAYGGMSVQMGRRVWLETDYGVDMVVTEFPCLTHDPAFLRSLGIRPEKYDVIVQKTHKLFQPLYKDIAKSILVADTPGYTDRNVKRLPYRKIRRPIYPLDDCCEEHPQ